MPNKKSKSTKLSAWGKIWRIALAIAVPLGGGFIISLFTRDAMSKFSSFNQPPLAPPAWLFPVAWTILYVLMGLASYFIWKKGYDSKKAADKSASKTALIIYAIQLVFNFVWTPLFFGLGWYWPAFIWLMVMWVLIIVLMVKTYKISRPAFWMLLPYIIWCTFAAYLNCGIAILN
ncbi:tryptophan-rich sensory protein [Candidatus Saccharibacteria bacterium]|nr:tryptophan-rich sensory protein [Candidatus Saccharibacteria bacterium]